jgi:glycosyltransferase involved in cell wall biosynthesis
MRVCMVVYAFYESDTRVLQYANALAERGDVVDVFALRREGSPAQEVLNGVNVYRIQTRRVNERGKFAYLRRILRFFFLSLFCLTRRHMAKSYDAVHVHSVPDFLVFAALIPKLGGSRIILDIHDILPEFYASKFGVKPSSLLFRSLLWIEKLSCRFADQVIIANHIWYERLVQRAIPAAKCTPIINYPDPTMFRLRQNTRDDHEFRIIYPGSLNYHQGLDIAIEAFAKVADEMPGARFHIYGEGPTKKVLLEQVAKLSLEERVLFHDFLPTEEIAEVMASADLAVVPKRVSSGFGNEAASTKIMEFMSLGVPVIVSRTRVDTYYFDDKLVRFFESENVAELASSILDLWRKADVRRKMSADALEYIRKNSWTEAKEGYLKLVEGKSCESTNGAEVPGQYSEISH